MTVTPILPNIAFKPPSFSFANKFGPAARTTKKLEPLTEEEESDILGTTIGAVQYLGESVDKPWAASRGILHGLTNLAQGKRPKWGGGALNLIPFSDAIGLTKPDEKIYGRELLTTMFNAPKNIEGLSDWGWDLAGLGAELLVGPPILPGGRGAAFTGKALAAQRGTKFAANLGESVGKLPGGLVPLSKVDDPAKLLKNIKGGRIVPATQAGTEGASRQFVDVVKSGVEGHTILGLNAASKSEEMRKGMRGVWGFIPTWPWSMVIGKDPIKVFGAGNQKLKDIPLVGKLINSDVTIPDLFDMINYGRNSPLVAGRQMFSGQIKGLAGGLDQKHAALIYAARQNARSALSGYMPAVRIGMGRLEEQYLGLVEEFGKSGNDDAARMWDDLYRDVAENALNIDKNVANSEDVISYMIKEYSGIGSPQADVAVTKLARETHKLLSDNLVHIKDSLYSEAAGLGLRAEALDDFFISHWPRRFKDPGMRELAEQAKERLFGSFGWASRRGDAKRDIPGGTATLNALSMDMLLAKPVTGENWMRSYSKTANAFLGKYPSRKDMRRAVRQFSPGKSAPVMREYLPPGAIKTEIRMIGDLVKKDGTPGIGRVRTIEADGSGFVDFTIQTGENAVQKVDNLDELVDVGRLPAGTPIPPPNMLSRQQLPLIREALKRYGPKDYRNWKYKRVGDNKVKKVEKSVEELKTDYAFYRTIEPAAVANGVTDTDVRVLTLDKDGDLMREAIDAKMGSTKVLTEVPVLNDEGLPVLKDGVAQMKTTSIEVNVMEWLHKVKSKQVAGYFGKLPSSADGMFNRSFVNDWEFYMAGLLDITKGLQNVHSLGQATVHANGGTDDRELVKAWNSISGKSNRPVLSKAGLHRFIDDAIKNPEIADKLDPDWLVADEINYEAIGQALRVPDRTAHTWQKMYDVYNPQSETASAFGLLWDSYRTLWKSSATVTMPFNASFFSRNVTSGFGMAILSEDAPYSGLKFAKRFFAHADYIAGSPYARLKGKAHGSQLPYLKELDEEDVLGNAMIKDIISGESSASGADNILDVGKGLLPRGFLGGTASYNPLKSPGIANYMMKKGIVGQDYLDEGMFALFESGQKAYELTEKFLLRGPIYDAARAEGWGRGEAKHLADRLQYVYGKKNLSPFEEKYLSRVVFPFYGWMKNNLSRISSELMNRPGGRHAQAVRSIVNVSRESGQLPSWLKEALAIRLSSNDPETGEANIMYQWGLHFEDFKTIDPRGKKGLIRTSQMLAASADPIFQTAAKLATKMDFRTGRPLKWMSSNLTGIGPIDRYFEAHPESATTFQALPLLPGLATKYRKAVHPGKHGGLKILDLLTGVKVGRYDMERQHLYDLQRALQKMLADDPFIRNADIPYVPRFFKGREPPETVKRLEQASKVSVSIKGLKDKDDIKRVKRVYAGKGNKI